MSIGGRLHQSTETLIRRMKKSTEKLAWGTSIQLMCEKETNSVKACGYLVPIGSWALKEPKIINSVYEWRKKNMHYFFARFTATYESAKEYLKTASVNSSDRLLFLIYDNDKKLIGHAGISNVSSDSCELDNVVRGDSPQNPSLMGNALVGIIKFAFNELGVSIIHLKVLSTNDRAISRYQSLGFSKASMLPLCEINTPLGRNLVPCSQGESNVDERELTMKLDAKTFSVHNPSR